MLPGDVLYEMSSWTRSILVPLSIVQARGSNRRRARGVHPRRTPAPRRQPRAPQGEGPFGPVSPPRPRFQALGKARPRAHPQRRHPRGRALDSRPHAPHRRPGRHLPRHDVLHHGARRAGLSQGPPRPGGGHSPLRIPAHRNRGPLHLPALRLAHLGYRHLRLRAGRSRRRRRRPHDARRRLADQQGGPPQRRLVRQAARHRALRLGLRIRQRVLSRYRRHRHGAAGAAPRQGVQPHGPGRRRAPRHQLAARHAIGRRRLGGIRRR